MDKLLFGGVRPRLSVIANQCAHWCGNPPVEWNQVTITSNNRNNPRFPGFFGTLLLYPGDFHGRPARWLAMTTFFKRTLTNTNLSFFSAMPVSTLQKHIPLLAGDG